MSASPTTATAPSQKRPLEEPSSPSGPGDQPDAKRPALNKIVKEDDSGHGRGSDTPVHAISVEEAQELAGPLGSADGAATANSAVDNGVAGVLGVAQNGDKDGQGDTVVPDAPLIGRAVLDTQPIQSTSSANGRTGSQGTSAAHQDETGWLHVRAIISSAEAATVIGKGGENVTLIRRMSGAKCTVSDYSRGAVERILTVSGMVDAVAKVSDRHHKRQLGLTETTGFRLDHQDSE